MKKQSSDDYVSEEEMEDVRTAVIAHAKKWKRSDNMACAIFDEFLRQIIAQSEPFPELIN